MRYHNPLYSDGMLQHLVLLPVNSGAIRKTACLLSFATRTYPFGIDGLPTEKTKADAFKAEILEATLDAIADKVREYAPSRLTTCEVMTRRKDSPQC
jgi:hypothetical protein